MVRFMRPVRVLMFGLSGRRKPMLVRLALFWRGIAGKPMRKAR